MFRDRAHAVQHDDSGQQHGHAHQNRAPVGVGTRSGHEKVFSIAISLFLVETLSTTPSSQPVRDTIFALYRDVLDPVRQRGQEKF